MVIALFVIVCLLLCCGVPTWTEIFESITSIIALIFSVLIVYVMDSFIAYLLIIPIYYTTKCLFKLTNKVCQLLASLMLIIGCIFLIIGILTSFIN